MRGRVKSWKKSCLDKQNNDASFFDKYCMYFSNKDYIKFITKLAWDRESKLATRESFGKILEHWGGHCSNLIGGSAVIWKIQHNILHHTYTNIDEADDDLNAPFFLRFSPHAKHYWVHQFQHIYIWFFYSISTISWITSKDFVRLKRYKNMGFFDKKNEYEKTLAAMIAWKLLYYSYALILPMIMLPFSWGMILVAFLCMHFVTGFLVSIIFQIAHIMPSTDFPLPNNNGEMNECWYGHQLATTTNFSPNSRLLYWLIGGLNYQVEHHVLPDVCHVHYKDISKIVATTAEEFGMKYHVKSSLFQAISAHTKMLRSLGRK